MEERGDLLPRRRDVPRLGRRRHRRHPRPDGAHRLPGGDRGQLPVADAVPALPQPRRRLRRHRLLRRRSAARLARGLRDADPDREGSRDARDHRHGREPHLGQAPVVPRGAVLARQPVPRLLRLARPADAHVEGLDRVPGRRGQHLGLRREGRAVVPPSLLLAPARPEHRQRAGPRRDRQDRRVLARARRRRLPGGRRAVPDRHEPGPRREPRPARDPAAPPLVHLPPHEATACCSARSTWNRSS